MDSLQRYINSIKSFGRITREEEKKLSRIIFYSRNSQNVIQAREKMAHCNLMLVVSRALRFSSMYGLKEADTMDLISEGNIGLIRAIKLYRSDHVSGASFATYAIFHIDQKISHFVKSNKFLRVPEYYLRFRKKLEDLEFKYKDKLTNKMIMKELNISFDLLEMLRDKKGKPVIFLEDISGEEGKEWEDTINDEKAVSPYQVNCIKSLGELLDKYINCLTEREASIVRHVHYSEEVMTLNDIANIVHVSRERVRQIYLTSLRKLRVFMIKGFDHCEERESKKHIRYGRRGTWRYNEKTMEEREKFIDQLVNDLSIL